MEILDFRSDTVTRPTPEMREAMAAAEVGDDVYGEDPTVNRLQEIAADMMGMEAGLFVPSGTMGNLVAMLAHCSRGDEVILGNMAHTFLYEGGGLAALGGISTYPIPNQPDGTMDLDTIHSAIRMDDPHFPISRLVAIENTHNRCGGVSLTVEYTQSVADLAHENGLKFHIDGARIFNAAVELGVDVRELTSPVDSVTFCISKALSAPVGSVLCGSNDFIHKAHRERKKLGGGMRQAGILAAAGIVALEHMVDRLSEDHRRAKVLAKGIAGIQGIELDLDLQHTNMVYFNLSDKLPMTTEVFLDETRKNNLLFGWVGGRRFRMVTHYWVDDFAVQKSIEIISQVIGDFQT
jgi:threonine aldolase